MIFEAPGSLSGELIYSMGEITKEEQLKRPVHLERSFHLDRIFVLRESRERAIPDRGSLIQHDVGVCIGDRRGRVQHKTHSNDRKDQRLSCSSISFDALSSSGFCSAFCGCPFTVTSAFISAFAFASTSRRNF